MDWKKIRRAICGAAAAVAVCFTAAGMNTKPVYAADMGAVYGIFAVSYTHLPSHPVEVFVLYWNV